MLCLYLCAKRRVQVVQGKHEARPAEREFAGKLVRARTRRNLSGLIRVVRQWPKAPSLFAAPPSKQYPPPASRPAPRAGRAGLIPATGRHGSPVPVSSVPCTCRREAGPGPKDAPWAHRLPARLARAAERLGHSRGQTSSPATDTANRPRRPDRTAGPTGPGS